MDTSGKPATSRVFGAIFDKIFPHKVRLRGDVRRNEALEWLRERSLAPSPDSHVVDHTWRAQREVAFMDAKLAMEFKLIFG